jgi:hypothetical protein
MKLPWRKASMAMESAASLALIPTWPVIQADIIVANIQTDSPPPHTHTVMPVCYICPL